MRTGRGLLVLLLAVSLAVSACTGIPSSSPPLTVRTVGPNSGSATTEIGPRAGDEPRSIVQGFLRAAVSADAKHSGSRQFLTADAGSRWQDGTTTIVNSYQVLLADTRGDTSTVTVTGQRVGQLDAHGVYTPERSGSGVAPSSTFVFTVQRTNGAWRIASLPVGVLISLPDFETYYTDRILYFYDNTKSQLVPDVRYSALRDLSQVVEWLLAQVLAGPRPELVQAVRNEIPDQVDARRATVSVGDVIQIEIPGSSQLDDAAQQRLATQLAYTFGPVSFSARFTLTDSGKAVPIPGVGTVFSASDFAGMGSDSVATDAHRYYIRNGGVVDGVDDRPLPGTVGNGAYGLTALALSRPRGASLQVAGLGNAGLLLGGNSILAAVSLPSTQLSRPDFRPGTDQVWIGAGGAIYRVGPDRRAQLVALPATIGGLPHGQILTLRFSPDGVRVAVVVKAADGSASLRVGSVITQGSTVSVDDFVPITPVGLSVEDVAWKDATSLLILASVNGGEPQVWSLRSDGSSLDIVQSAGLPPGLRTIAAMIGQPALVGSDGPALWIQSAGGWSSLSGTGQTDGSAPAYSE